MVIPALLILISLAVVGGMSMAHTIVVAKEMHQSNDVLDRQLQLLRIQNQEDDKAIRLLDDPAGIEWVARGYGYIYPTEYRLKIPQ